MKNTINIVQELNEELYEKTKKDNVWFSYTMDNYVDSIAFNTMSENHTIKIELWNSENSQQEFREATDDYEPLENTIKREVFLAIDTLSSIFGTEKE